MSPEIIVPGHCLLLEENARLALVDTGIGLQDIQNPLERLGNENINGSAVYDTQFPAAV
jgi:hypothetical protein